MKKNSISPGSKRLLLHYRVDNFQFSVLFLIVFLGILLFPLISFAQGLVPCGTDETHPCQLCDLFVLFDNIIDFVLFKIVPPLAVLMLAIGGFLFFFAGSPSTLSQAKSIITSTLIGLLIIYTAFLIIGIFLMTIGLADWTENIYKNWWTEGFFTFPCS